MNYCSDCGAPVTRKVPEDDDRERFVCDTCSLIHYQNPKIVAGCIPVYEDRILLCKRAIEPRKGFWTLPAGFMELGETVQQAAQRETREEANASVGDLELYTVLNLPHVSQVYMMFRSNLAEPVYSAGRESLDVKLCDEADIPWQDLAFPTITLHATVFFQ